MHLHKTLPTILNTTVLLILLFSTWLVLSGHFEPFFLVVGGASCIVAVVIMRCLGIRECRPCTSYYSFRGITYLMWLAKEIVVSSIDVAKRVWQVKPQISPTIAWVQTKQTNDVGCTIFANSITLTPGTVSMLVYGDKLCVHALTQEGMKSLQEGGMDRKITAIQRTQEER